MQIMDGPKSTVFQYFKSLLVRGFIELKKHSEFLIKIVEVMSKGNKLLNQLISF